MKNRLFIPAVALGFVAGGAHAQPANIVEVFTEAEAGAPVGLTFLETVTTSPDGLTAYAVLRDTTAADVGGITAFNGGSFTAVMTPADYAATGSTNDYAAGNGAGVVGGVVRGISFFDNNVYEVNIGTGAITEVVTAAAIQGAAGTANANLSAVNEVAPDGTIYGIESDSDQLLAISPGNTVSVEINTADLATLLGGTSIGGIGVAGDTIYLGSNSSDSLVAWNTATNTGSTVLTEAQIESVTDDIDGTAGFGDIFFAPNGLVYFYESDSDHLLSFNPNNPVSTLSAVITEAEFTAGPSSDTINQLSWYVDRVAFTDGGIGFYTPEPTAAALLGLGGIALLRRRSA